MNRPVLKFWAAIAFGLPHDGLARFADEGVLCRGFFMVSCIVPSSPNGCLRKLCSAVQRTGLHSRSVLASLPKAASVLASSKFRASRPRVPAGCPRKLFNAPTCTSTPAGQVAHGARLAAGGVVHRDRSNGARNSEAAPCTQTTSAPMSARAGTPVRQEDAEIGSVDTAVPSQIPRVR
jgi:hypothetical protein